MRQKAGPQKAPAEQAIKDIRRATRKHHGAEEKICIVLEGLRGEESIAALCRREGIAESLYYSWSKEFTYLKVIGWGVLRTHLSTVLDDFSRYIVAWKLCTTMKADDVTAIATGSCGRSMMTMAYREPGRTVPGRTAASARPLTKGVEARAIRRPPKVT